MTGLDPAEDRILEAAVIILDHQWEELAIWETAVCQPPDILAGMNDWCQQHHQASGLLDRVPAGISEPQLDEQLSELVKAHWGGLAALLCGNSIHQDRRFIDRWLPHLSQLLHYRMLDVSSFKVVFQEFYGQTYEKQNRHRALDDIRESIAELRFYLKHIQAPPPQ